MLKLLPLFLIALPFSALSAEQTIESDSDTSINNEALSGNSPAVETSTKEPRSTEFFFRQCYQNVPPVTEDPNKLPMEQTPVNIEARTLSGSPDKLVYQDDVKLRQGDKYLSADKLTYFVEQEKVNAEGNANFINGSVTLDADSIERRLKTDQTLLYQSDYQFHGRGGRGNAERIYDNGQDLYELNSSTYSACPPGDNTWTIDSTTLYIDNEAEMGSAYNAVLRVKDVPVFYFPYFTYPTTDKRKTGLLFPTYETSSTNGTTITQPLYINIAENMDATITPTYMSERGTLVAAEYRYLLDAGSGKMQAEYLGDDQLRDESRYLYHWNHSVSFAGNWSFSADYNRVSDDYYFSDIDTDYGTRSDNQLLQTAKLRYTEESWNSELEVRDFQILGGGDTPHKVMPKLALSAYQPIDWKSLQLDWYSEISKFEHDDDNVYKGTRIHLEPKLSLPLYYNSLFVNSELKYMLSFYEQTLPESNKESWYSDLDENVSRFIPSFKIHSGINFEREFTAFDNQYRQTLVPQVQYLYVPYQDQSNIGIYDTTTMQQDYYGLFRDNRYSGYDRIADANQLTLGVSSSFLNARGREKMRIAVGQNFYFSESEVELPTSDGEDQTASRSSIIAELDINFDNDYFYHGGIEWDSESNVINRANSTFEKRWASNTYAQLNYRYIANQEDTSSSTQVANLVNQFGTKINWSINSQWTSYASYYYDMEYKHAYESIIGINYQSCCWALGLSYDNHMLPYYGSLDTITEDYQTERSFKLTFELMGLGGVGFSSGEQGLFDYGRPFYLK
ncbi:LPS assembly protein LptD [Psychromonas aquimarina]|uniref:LPS assembly protein LptD n=1 Tax=Psychromonas aquimarina TaxID=444919 RepID=UPI0003F7B6EB|nr:LPS assembly protein LptD [Psychromonas aquimarina]